MAQFYCNECKSYQCSLCESILHELNQEEHPRYKLSDTNTNENKANQNDTLLNSNLNDYEEKLEILNTKSENKTNISNSNKSKESDSEILEYFDPLILKEKELETDNTDLNQLNSSSSSSNWSNLNLAITASNKNKVDRLSKKKKKYRNQVSSNLIETDYQQEETNQQIEEKITSSGDASEADVYDENVNNRQELSNKTSDQSSSSSSDDICSKGYVTSNQTGEESPVINNINQTRTKKSAKKSSSEMTTTAKTSPLLIRPLDCEQNEVDDLDDDLTNNHNNKNGWSDVNLSTTPPSENEIENGKISSKKNKKILLPDVAQLSLSSTEANGTAATLNLNGYDDDSNHFKLTNGTTPVRRKIGSDLNKLKKDKRHNDHLHQESKESDTERLNNHALENGVDEIEEEQEDEQEDEKPDCFLLIDEQEVLQVKTTEEFIAKLGCNENTLVKVVSIFGNTGEGKSHTLNYTFYDCEQVFRTSRTQNSCTIGIWCAYDRRKRVITIDTEGLLGLSDNNNRRTRLLLKVLAISDVIIYRTRAERLHTDLFTFLGSASEAYMKHFAKELRAASKRCNLQCTLSDLGPIVIIFHETVHTDVLHQENDLAPEDVIRQRFNKMSLSTEAYSAFEYVGIKTLMPPTNFDSLQRTVHKHLTNSTVRSPRTPSVIFNSLKVLSQKFNGEIQKITLNPFPDEYFTCSQHCLSCKSRCNLSMNHSHDGIPHKSNSKCKFQHQYSNVIYYCRSCFERGEEVPVIPKTCASTDSNIMGLAKYAWAGFVMECRFCGIIYRSRQFWYGNKDPGEQPVVQKEILHVWEDEPLPSQGMQQNSAQKVVDSVNFLSETVTNMSAKPSKLIGSWMADQINPSYWVPNARIQHCGRCQKEFEPLEDKHHCRRCGGGFCTECSSKYQPVPERGWGDQPVRVCDGCFEKGQRYPDALNGEVTARKMSEAIHSTLGSVMQTIDSQFVGWIKESARPDYWIPDKDIINCIKCKLEFTDRIPKHHCRACGQGVCDDCSQQRKSVPSRGWDHPVRVCDECAAKKTVAI